MVIICWLSQLKFRFGVINESLHYCIVNQHVTPIIKGKAYSRFCAL